MSHAIVNLLETMAKNFNSAFCCILLFKILIIRRIWSILLKQGNILQLEFVFDKTNCINESKFAKI